MRRVFSLLDTRLEVPRGPRYSKQKVDLHREKPTAPIHRQRDTTRLSENPQSHKHIKHIDISLRPRSSRNSLTLVDYMTTDILEKGVASCGEYNTTHE